eukprot:COSAG02_NODE_667_length_18713_cov_17.795262_13_plen_119_part_00
MFDFVQNLAPGRIRKKTHILDTYDPPVGFGFGTAIARCMVVGTGTARAAGTDGSSAGERGGGGGGGGGGRGGGHVHEVVTSTGAAAVDPRPGYQRVARARHGQPAAQSLARRPRKLSL